MLSAIGTEPYKLMTSSPLTDRFQLVYVDLRGGGRSTGDPTDLSFDVLARDLEAIRWELGLERLAVLGHSILGVLALEYGRRCPGSVSHVVAVGTPTVGDMQWMTEQGRLYFDTHASEERKQVLRENFANLPKDASMSESMYAQTPIRFYDAHFDARSLFVDAEVMPALLGHIIGTLTAGWRVAVGARSLQVPTLVAMGRHDYIVPVGLWEDVVDDLPDATLRIFEKSGHQPFFEEPELFAETMARWMA
ncbi:MAG: alpha/beta hydrolase [Acidobacteriota bacterium]